MNERQLELAKAYATATAELRRAHDDEFHSILAAEYERRNIPVRKRRSKQQKKHDRYMEALELVRSFDSDSKENPVD